MAVFTLNDPLDFKTVTSIFLYGKTAPPTEIFDRIRLPGQPQDTIQIDAVSFMSPTGVGRFATANQAQFVKDFFDITSQATLGWLPPAVQAELDRQVALHAQDPTYDGTVRLKVSDLKNLGVSAGQFHFAIRQREWDVGINLDYAARTYIYNSEGFSIDPNATFVFDMNDLTKSYIDDMRVIPDPDNFDFKSDDLSGAALGGALVLIPQIDPYNLSQSRQPLSGSDEKPLLMEYMNKDSIPTTRYAPRCSTNPTSAAGTRKTTRPR